METTFRVGVSRQRAPFLRGTNRRGARVRRFYSDSRCARYGVRVGPVGNERETVSFRG